MSDIKLTDYPDLLNLLGKKKLNQTILHIKKLNPQKHNQLSRIFFSSINGFIKKNDNDDITNNLLDIFSKKKFYKLSEFYNKRSLTVLKKLILFLLEINKISTDNSSYILSQLLTDSFKKFISNTFLILKDPIYIEKILNLIKISISRNQLKNIDKFIRLIGSSKYKEFMKTYQNYSHELLLISHNSLLLLLNYPKRKDYIIFIEDFMNNKIFFSWIETFHGQTYDKDENNKSIPSNDYLIYIFYYIFLLGDYNSEFSRIFDSLTEDENIINKLRGGKKGKFHSLITLINSGIYFQDSFIFKDFMEFFINYHTTNYEKKEIFYIVAEGIMSNFLDLKKKKKYIKFYISKTYTDFFKLYRKISIDTLIFMTHLSSFSLRFNKGEYFKIIEEENLFQLITKTGKRDKIFHNYIELFKYIENFLKSKTLRLKLILFFYFHFSQIALGSNKTKIIYINNQHRLFTETLEKRYFRAGGTKDPDMEKPLFYLRLDQLIDIIGTKKLNDKEYLSYFYLLDLSANMQLEDELYVSLISILKNNDLIEYELFIREKFLDDPYNISLYLSKGGFYKIYFKDYRKDIVRSLIPVIKLIPVKESEWAKTDNKNIYLPNCIYEFDDKKILQNILPNRNYGLFIYLGLHEFSHIFSKSFEYDFKTYFIEQTVNPESVFNIFNIIEDYRSEYILLESSLINEYKKLFIEARKFYANQGLGDEPITKIFQMIMSELYWDKKAEHVLYNYKEEIIEFSKISIVNKELNKKGFYKYKDLTDHIIKKIRQMNMKGASYSIYLSVEVFNLLNLEFNMEKLESNPHGEKHSNYGDKQIENNNDDKDDNKNPEYIKTNQGVKSIDPDDEGRAIGEEKDGKINESSNTASGNDNEENTLSENEKKKYLSDLYNDLNNGNYEYGTPDIDEKNDEEEIDDLIDNSKRTISDSHLGESMINNSPPPIIKPGDIDNLKNKEEIERERKNKIRRAKKHKKQNVFSYNSNVKGYTDIRELELYTITGWEKDFFEKLKPFLYIIDRISDELAYIIPELGGQTEYSETEGEFDENLALEIFTHNKKESMPKIFKYTEKKDLSEIEIIIGLDASGSTYLSAGDSDLSILDVEKIFAYLLGKSFEQITDNISYYAFNSLSSTNIYHFPTIEDISTLQADGGNRDGDFIRYIKNILIESDSSHKYFFLLSDGAPNAENYIGKSAITDTAMAMNEVLQNQINLIYFNIDPYCSDYFEEFVLNTTYAENFKNPNELINKVSDMVIEIVSELK